MRIACALIFLGWGWLHLLGDIPFRTIFWDEGLLKGIVEGLSAMTWKEWVTHPGVDRFVQNLVYTTGIFYCLCCLATIKLNPNSIWLGRLILAGATGLIILAFLFFKEKFYHLGQFFEYAIQWGSPILLYLIVRRGWTEQKILFYLKIAIALTFVCHGLYAVGYYPVPGNFLDMVIGIFNVSESTAQTLLTTVGILDFVIGVLIFLPRRMAVPFLAYAVFWGFATALARVTSYFDADFMIKTVVRWLPETLLRLAHGVIPLVALIISMKLGQKSSD